MNIEKLGLIEEKKGVVLVYKNYTNFGTLSAAFERLDINFTKATLERIANTPSSSWQNNSSMLRKSLKKFKTMKTFKPFRRILIRL